MLELDEDDDEIEIEIVIVVFCKTYIQTTRLATWVSAVSIIFSLGFPFALIYFSI